MYFIKTNFGIWLLLADGKLFFQKDNALYHTSKAKKKSFNHKNTP